MGLLIRSVGTYAQLPAASAVPAGTVIQVGNDPNTALNGFYRSNGSSWIAASGAPTGNALGILAYPGSTYPAPNGLAGTAPDADWEYVRIKRSSTFSGVMVKYDNIDMTNNAYGRELQLEGGNAYSFPAPLDGGAITIKGGKGNTQPVVMSGAGGDAQVIGGDGVGPGNGGVARVKGGYAGATGKGGAAYVVGGSADAGRDGGDVYVLGGENYFQNATGGSVRLRGGNGTTDGTVYVGDSSTEAVRLGAQGIRSHVEGPTVLTPAPFVMIDAVSDSFDPVTSLIAFDVDNGPYTLTSTPTVLVASATQGQIVRLLNAGASGYIELQRGATYGLQLAAATRKIDVGGSITLLFDGSNWIEIGHVETTTL